MLLSRQAGYAIEAVLQLARANTSRPLSSGKLAAAGNMPVRYLLAILRKLVRCGILRSRRGATGGYVLAKAPSAISVLDLIEGVDGPVTQIWIRPEARGQRNGNRQNRNSGNARAFAASFAAATDDVLGDAARHRRDEAHSSVPGWADAGALPPNRQSKASARAFGQITTGARAFLASLTIGDLAGTAAQSVEARSTDILEFGRTSADWAGGNWVI
jgi:Rrf2 family protein